MKLGLKTTAMIVASALILVACATTPEKFGMPATEFDSLSQAEQSQVIENYNKKLIADDQRKTIRNFAASLIAAADENHSEMVASDQHGRTSHC